MVSTLVGLVLLSVAGSYRRDPVLGAMLIGVGSAVFHPESSRVARMASGGRHGLAQSLFQVGGNTGSALGPLLAAALVVRLWPAQRRLVPARWRCWASLILYNVGTWYKHHGLARMRSNRAHEDMVCRAARS